MTLHYGNRVSDDDELRLLHDPTDQRILEVGVFVARDRPPNAVALALSGARVVSIDPDAERVALVRAAAEQAEVHVQCRHSDLADLGFASSATFDAAVSVLSLDRCDDLPRLLRQVHRVLKPSAPFLISIVHPVAAMFDGTPQAVRRYGAHGSITELYTSFERANFHFDALHELFDAPNALAPAVLVGRAHKVGS